MQWSSWRAASTCTWLAWAEAQRYFLACAWAHLLPLAGPFLPQVLGLQRSSRLLPSRAAARSLLRAAADPAQHDELMAAFFAGQQVPAHEQPAYGAGAGAGAASAAPPASAPPASSGLSSAHSRGSSTGLSEQDEADADAESLLAEAATFGAVDADTDG